MAQLANEFAGRNDEGAEGQVQDTQFDLKTHLSKYKVSDTVYKLLCDESITVDELITLTNEELKDWCNENSLKTMDKKRFINAVKSLPNAQANRPDNEPVSIGNEEKEQISQFDEMKNNVKNVMNYISQVQNKSDVDKIIQEINDVCDKIQSFVESLRKNLLKQVSYS